MKILQLVPRLPYPQDDGGKIGIAGILEAFDQLGHNVALAGFDEEGRRKVAEELLANRVFHLHVQDIPSWRVLRAKVLVALGISPYVREKYYSQTFARNVLAQVSNWTPDLLHVDHSHMGSYAMLVKKLYPHVHVWVRAHNVEATLWERRAEVSTDRLRRVLFRRQARLVAGFEKRLFESVDGVLAITDVDSVRVRQLAPSANVHVMPAGCDLKHESVLRPNIGGDLRLCFVGSLEYSANIDGISWFINQIWPRIGKEFPGATLTVAGRSSRRLKFLEGSPGIRFVGFVPDVREVTDNADIAIVPLRIGGGMRLKVLDFMSRGLPVLCTRVGGEGIPRSYKSAPTMLMAEDSEDFICQLRTLMPLSARSTVAAAGRAMVRDKYSWNVLVEAYCRLVEEGASERRLGSEGRRQSEAR